MPLSQQPIFISHAAEPFVYEPHHGGPRDGEMSMRAELLAKMQARRDLGSLAGSRTRPIR